MKLGQTNAAQAGTVATNEQLRTEAAQLRDEAIRKDALTERTQIRIGETEVVLAELKEKHYKVAEQLASTRQLLAVSKSKEATLELDLATAAQRTQELHEELVLVSRQNARLESELSHCRQALASGLR